ncbi:carbohydrate-binding protein [Streptomyces edwardsiae]|uniref:Carbohydrate-binding protein n=1 Tax=Streptomyces edwardsiae TaxID=3075527 RepID=A0ABU2QMW5_9ACTN|nr:carbohydrate-binding protein [Streptomyces sp. DSM 41635]MDT0405199.1 carbohydrate-binding protein [Streptomyces sp. DSM 41635]
MTAGNNGASTPEDDDPFGYLYADGQANGAQPPSGGYGYPNSVNRVRPVGTRQYGAPGAGAPQAPQQQGVYGQPSAHYAAPETLPGGAPSAHPSHGGGGGRGRGPNTKGLLIGAIAVVAAVVIGIGIAMIGGDDDDKGDNQADSTPTQSQDSGEPTPSVSEGDDGDKETAELPTIDAKTLRLGGTAATASDVEGAQSDGGVYVAGLNQPGNSVTWTVDGIPEDGAYTVFVRYSTADEDQSMTLTVNGKEFGSKVNMGNFAHAKDGDFSKGWTKTYSWPTLNKGTNTISVSCADGDKCNVLLDQMWLKKGQVKD